MVVGFLSVELRRPPRMTHSQIDCKPAFSQSIPPVLRGPVCGKDAMSGEVFGVSRGQEAGSAVPNNGSRGLCPNARMDATFRIESGLSLPLVACVFICPCALGVRHLPSWVKANTHH